MPLTNLQEMEICIHGAKGTNIIILVTLELTHSLTAHMLLLIAHMMAFPTLP